MARMHVWGMTDISNIESKAQHGESHVARPCILCDRMGIDQPTSIDLKKDRGLTIEWADGTTSYYAIAYLRAMSPSADMKELRRSMDRNPLTVLPTGARGAATRDVVAVDAELVGNYAMRITFSDGHASGIYSWSYLRSIDRQIAAETSAEKDAVQQELDEPEA